MVDNSQERISLGHVTGVSGLKGLVKVHSDTNPRENIVSYPSWWLEQSGQWRQVVVVEGRPQGKTIVARIEGIATPEQASTLIGAKIAVDRHAMPALSDGEFYWADLVGMQVHTVEGIHVGTACRLFETGANDVLVVTDERQLGDKESSVVTDESDSGKAGKRKGAVPEVLVPWLVPDVIRDVDMQNNRILIDWDPDF